MTVFSPNKLWLYAHIRFVLYIDLLCALFVALCVYIFIKLFGFKL